MHGALVSRRTGREAFERQPSPSAGSLRGTAKRTFSSPFHASTPYSCAAPCAPAAAAARWMVTPDLPHHVRVELVVCLAVDVVAVAEPVVLAARRVPRDVLRVVVRVEDRVEVLARVGGLRRHLGASKVRCWAWGPTASRGSCVRAEVV